MQVHQAACFLPTFGAIFLSAFPVSIINRFIRRSNVNQGAEMSFIDHIEELRWHIIRSVIAVAVCGIATFFNIEWIFQHIILAPTTSKFVSYRILCKLADLVHLPVLCFNENTKMDFQSLEFSGQFMMSFSSSFTIGIIVAFPYIFWEFWRFLSPALQEHERRNARGIVFWCSMLFFLGVLFAYYVIGPFTISFFANYQLSPNIKNNFTLSSYYDTMSDLILGMGLVFELPIVVYFLSKLGILTPALMRKVRRYAVVVIVLVSAVITPPDWLSIWLVAFPLLALYEISILLSARVAKERLRRQIALERANSND